MIILLLCIILAQLLYQFIKVQNLEVNPSPNSLVQQQDPLGGQVATAVLVEQPAFKRPTVQQAQYCVLRNTRSYVLV